MKNFIFIIIFFSMLCTYGQKIPESWREKYFSGEALQIGNRIQFLFDDYNVEDKYGLKRVIGPVQKYSGNPLSFGDFKLWEKYANTTSYDGSGIYSYQGIMLSNVIFDPKEKLYKGWYVIKHERIPRSNYQTLYVESNDGITWVKPKLDIFHYKGQKTNIVLYDEKETAILEDVILDTLAIIPEKRYVGLVKMVPPGENTRCIVHMYSPDGKKWTFADNPILFRGASDGSYSLVQDIERNRWLIYRRPPTHALVRETKFYADRNDNRRVSVILSKDMKHWTYPRNIVLMDELDDLKLTQVGNKMDIDWAKVIKHEGVFFGFLDLMDNLAISIPRQSHLMWSRDGLEWDRLPDRASFIENGASGEWDAGSIGRHSFVEDPDGKHFRIYYGLGGNTPQRFYGASNEEDIPRFRGTGLAIIKKDRFIGLAAGPEGGYLLTRQFVLEGDRIEINCLSQVQNSPPGLGSLIRAELLKPPPPGEHYPAQPYPGFSMEDCDSISVKDNLHQTISWNGNPDISKLHGKIVYIRFYIRNTTLYTFKIKNSQ